MLFPEEKDFEKAVGAPGLFRRNRFYTVEPSDSADARMNGSGRLPGRGRKTRHPLKKRFQNFHALVPIRIAQNRQARREAFSKAAAEDRALQI